MWLCSLACAQQEEPRYVVGTIRGQGSGSVQGCRQVLLSHMVPGLGSGWGCGCHLFPPVAPGLTLTEGETIDLVFPPALIWIPDCWFGFPFLHWGVGTVLERDWTSLLSCPGNLGFTVFPRPDVAVYPFWSLPFPPGHSKQAVYLKGCN